MAELGRLIRALRKEMGLSQEGFARQLGLTSNTVARYERGEFQPDPFNLLLIIKIAPDDWKARLLPHLPAEGARWLETLSQKQASAPRLGRSSRYSHETKQALHDALDVVLDRAPSTAVQKVTEVLTNFAGKYGDPDDPREPPANPTARTTAPSPPPARIRR